MGENILSLKNVTKLYPGVTALDSFSIDFEKGEVHALVGENGAGKSTLIKCLSGAIEPTDGVIVYGGEEHTHFTPKQSRDCGIEVVYQELNLIDSLSIAENVCLGEKLGKVASQKAMAEKTREIFRRMNVDLDPRKPVMELSTAQQQLVEIAKSLSKEAKILILDEPTAPLTQAEVDILFQIIEKLREYQVTVIYISHRIDEIFAIADRVTVMRDGQYIKTLKTAETNRKELIELMVGRELNEAFPRHMDEPGEKVLEFKNLTGNGVFDINMHFRAGEIVGLAGLVGAGRTELVKMVYGADHRTSGEVILNGQPCTFRSPKNAIQNGIGLIPEDRKQEGVFLYFGIDWNIAITHLPDISKGGFVQEKKVKAQAREYVDMLGIKTPSISQEVNNLSGGNQQKVALAKTLVTNSQIIIFDEPTRGIDVGAKQEIYQLMVRLVSEGKSIIMISSDMEELFGMADRIYVLAEGRQSGELSREEFSQVAVMELSSL